MGKGYCQHGCYPVDSRWHGGGLTAEVDGEEMEIDDIFDLRKYIRRVEANGGDGPEAAEALLTDNTPAGEPYVLPDPGENDSIQRKMKGRGISISGVGQGFDMSAHLTWTDTMSTHYKFNGPIKVRDDIRTTPQSAIHQEMTQRRQEAEQQINRVLSNLSDLYEQKQLLEHDQRKLEARMQHFEAEEESEVAGEGYEDELKADFVDIVDQHTGRHSILQMQSNNVFPSITADFYQMTGLDDLTDGGQLADLPENEKAVLRKKWKLYERWKDQFRSAVESRLRDVNRRLNSVETSIEQTERWLKPYVQDIERIQTDFEGLLETEVGLGKYLPHGYANTLREMKLIGHMDRSPAEHEGLYRDVVVTSVLQAATPNPEQPQQAGQGLVIYKTGWTEILVCEHVWDEVFQPQIDAQAQQVQRKIREYQGEPEVPVGEKREEVLGTYGDALTEDERERIEEAATAAELEEIEMDIIDRLKPGFLGRLASRVRKFFGSTDEFYHPDPSELRRQLMGPYFPTQFYLDYKYDNDLYVMK